MPLVIPYLDQTWVDGSGGGTPISAARLNVVEAGVKAAHFMPAVRVTHNATQSITSAVVTALAFNTERFDTASNAADTQHDTVTNNSRLTCRYAGKYQIGGNVEWAASVSAASGVELRIRLNGATTIARNLSVSSDARAAFISTLWDMAVNDYVELVVVQNMGINVIVNSSASYSPEFSMFRAA